MESFENLAAGLFYIISYFLIVLKNDFKLAFFWKKELSCGSFHVKTLISWLFGTGGVLFEITHSGILLVTRILESAVKFLPWKEKIWEKSRCSSRIFILDTKNSQLFMWRIKFQENEEGIFVIHIFFKSKNHLFSIIYLSCRP